MRHTEFWERMEEALGAQARPFARLTVLRELGQRTPEEALEAGMTPKEVWAAVHTFAELPPSLR
ncbi:DUF3046 domain-containing protein [Nocardioides sp. GY 10127]|uniref:DUF3046 domain-containing protein n=1 Tax=Nocardioides sp. GY 10127 TaxID=2569762 RepID=UPI0010A796EB|nr:DUF3046 domain-containing protein [Nocardioides sp. GY 10127]TIC85563.1 DUF3046 domain-containing protein [Nocardioides sp. GY 10127]